MKVGQSILRYINLTISRRIGGAWIRIPLIAGHKPGLTGERFLHDILVYFLPRLSGVVVDVGVNLGQTLCKVKLAEPDRPYFGFEPNPACHAYLEELVRANRWIGVSLFPCGISDRVSIMPLHVSDNDSTDACGSLFPDARPDFQLGSAKNVALFEYDDIDVMYEKKIGFLKIDVEGAELEVVRGMADSLRRDMLVIAIELMPIEALRGRHAQTIQLLQSYEYSVFVVEKRPSKRWAGLTKMSDYELPSDPNVNDFLAVPRGQEWLLDSIPGSR